MVMHFQLTVYTLPDRLMLTGNVTVSNQIVLPVHHLVLALPYCLAFRFCPVDVEHGSKAR